MQNCRHFEKEIADIINHFRQRKCGLSSETKILITPIYGKTLSENIFTLLLALTALGDRTQIEVILFVSHHKKMPNSS